MIRFDFKSPLARRQCGGFDGVNLPEVEVPENETEEDAMNLFDTINDAGGSDAFAALARQFGLSEDQARGAVEAVMPAFATGLKRNTEAADGFAGLLQALAGGQHAAYLDRPERAVSGDGIADGNAILGHLFGSKEVSRAVAAQADAATGIGEAVMKQMLPAIAAMVMGGLSKQSRGNSANPMLAEIMEQLTGGGAARQADDGPLDRYEREQPADNPLGDLLGQMMGGGALGGAGNPLGDLLGQMMGGGAADGGRQPRGQDVFGEMFEPGRQMGEAYQKNMENIFDRYLSGMDRRR